MRRNLAVYFGTTLLLGLAALLYVGQSAFEEDSLHAVLRATARLALLIYLLVFVARPLRQLSVSAFSKALLRNRRSLGIGFAGIMSVHLGFLLWVHWPDVVAAGMVVYALIILMLVTSFDGPTRALGPKRWKWLHKTGLYVIGIGFAQAQFGRILRGVDDPVHYVLAGLILVAIGIRVAAWLKSRRGRAVPVRAG